MRLQVSVPPDLWEALCALAEKESRTPRQQLGLITNEALRQALGQPKLPVEPGGVGESEQDPKGTREEWRRRSLEQETLGAVGALKD
jgi:hypothetical protein